MFFAEQQSTTKVVTPEAAYAVLKNLYMDDYLGSVKNPETALTLIRSLVKLLNLGGFILTKFISNIPNLSLKLSPPNTSANNSKEFLTAAINPETALHVLGLKWDHVTDKLVVREESTANSKTLLHSDRFLVLCPPCLTP